MGHKSVSFPARSPPFWLALAILFSPVMAQFEQMNFGEPKPCPPFRCRKGEEPVPKWPLKLESPGCSRSGAIMNVQDTQQEDEVLETCCDQRNACIQICGSLKVVCEQDFIACGEKACKGITDDEEKQQKCNQHVQLQKLLSSIGQCDEYSAAQAKSCKCISKENEAATEAREKFLTKFYSKYNPSQDVKKVGPLAQKADTARKMSTLVGKLIKKYPEAILKVKDPQQEMMEQMMKEARQTEPPTSASEQDSTIDDRMEDLGVEEL